jgi:hypothetical protein
VLISVSWAGHGPVWGNLSGAVVPDAIRKLFGENRGVVVKLNRRDLLVLAEEVTI